jgi:hypothetical protein
MSGYCGKWTLSKNLKLLFISYLYKLSKSEIAYTVSYLGKVVLWIVIHPLFSPASSLSVDLTFRGYAATFSRTSRPQG